MNANLTLLATLITYAFERVILVVMLKASQEPSNDLEHNLPPLSFLSFVPPLIDQYSVSIKSLCCSCLGRDTQCLRYHVQTSLDLNSLGALLKDRCASGDHSESLLYV